MGKKKSSFFKKGGGGLWVGGENVVKRQEYWPDQSDHLLCSYSMEAEGGHAHFDDRTYEEISTMKYVYNYTYPLDVYHNILQY